MFTICIVDDEQMWLDMFEKMITDAFSEDVELKAFLSVDAFRSWYVQKNSADVIFVDLALPTLKEGFGLISWIRDQKETRAPYVVAHSVSSNQDDVNQAYRNGAHAYLCKASVADEQRSGIVGFLEVLRTPNFLLPSGEEPNPASESSTATVEEIVRAVSFGNEFLSQDFMRRFPQRSFTSQGKWPYQADSIFGFAHFVERHQTNEEVAPGAIELKDLLSDLFPASSGLNLRFVDSSETALGELLNSVVASRDEQKAIYEVLSDSVLDDRWIITTQSPAEDKSLLEIIQSAGLVEHFIELESLQAFGLAFKVGASIGIVLISVRTAGSIYRFLDRAVEKLGDRYFKDLDTRQVSQETGNEQ